MRSFILSLCLMLASATSMAQGEKPFEARLTNSEYCVYLVIDFYRQQVMIPGQEVLGALPGYLGDDKDGRKWLITEAKIGKHNTARLTMVNDYGSEDLTAELVRNSDGTYTLKQIQGSTLKIARNRKWVKLPKALVFKR